MDGVPTVEITKAQLEEGYDLVSFLAETQIFPSKGEARKMWQSGGIGLNKEKNFRRKKAPSPQTICYRVSIY